MSVQTSVEVTIASVEVLDDYRIGVTMTDPESMAGVEVELTWTEAEKFAAELRDAVAAANRMLAEDHPVHRFGFDVDGPLNPECRAGKCGNCSGDTIDGTDAWVKCTHHCHGVTS